MSERMKLCHGLQYWSAGVLEAQRQAGSALRNPYNLAHLADQLIQPGFKSLVFNYYLASRNFLPYIILRSPLNYMALISSVTNNTNC